MKLICIMKNGSLEIGEMDEIIEKVRKKILSSLEKEKLPEKEEEYGTLSIVYCEFDERIDWKSLEKTSLKDVPILSRADIYPHLKKLEKEVTLYRKIKSRKSSLADILDAEEELKDILYQSDYNIDAEFDCNKIRPLYKIFKFDSDEEELKCAFKYYGDIRSDIAYNAGYDAGYDA